MPDSNVTDIDLEAYVDDQLDLRGRILVEEHLASSPDLAARVMADLRARSALRLLGQIGIGEPVPAALGSAMKSLAVRLEGANWSDRLWRALRVPAAAAAVMAVLLVVTPQPPASAGAPSFVEDAVMSHRTALIRAAMVSQQETHIFDRSEIDRSTRIRVPVLPPEWRIVDVQIFPSDEGPALQLMVTTTEGEEISIFAVRGFSSAPAQPVVTRRRGESVAYWRNGEISYAVTAAAAPEALELAARDLADNRLN